MARKLFFLMLILIMSVVISGAAYAQDDDAADDDTADDDTADDDTTDDDTADDDTVDDDTADDDSGDDDDFMASTLVFDAPTALEAETPYDFEFTVTNGATFNGDTDEKGEWIFGVDLSMPSSDYVVDESDLKGPTPLHGTVSEGDYQILSWDASFDPTSTTITWQCFGVVTSANYGDIREGEMLSFQFSATTDAAATDGFHWVLHGDLGTDVEGDAYINGGDDDNDDNDDSSKGDDDDSGGGCGC